MALYIFGTEEEYSTHYYTPITRSDTGKRLLTAISAGKAINAYKLSLKKSIREANNDAIVALVTINLPNYTKEVLDILVAESLTHIDTREEVPGTWAADYLPAMVFETPNDLLKLCFEFNRHTDKSNFELVLNGWSARESKIGISDFKEMIKERDARIEFIVHGIIEWKDTEKFEYDIEVTKVTFT